MKKIFKACLKREYHSEAWADVKTDWYVISPADNAQQRAFTAGYWASGCNSVDPRDCAVNSGVAFLKADAESGANFPSSKSQMWHQHKWNASWTVLAFALLFALIMGPFALAFLAVVGPGMAIAGAAMGASAGGLAIGAAAFVIDVAIYGVVSFAVSGGGAFGDAQNGMFGNISNTGAGGGGGAPPVNNSVAMNPSMNGYSPPAPAGDSFWNSLPCLTTGVGANSGGGGNHPQHYGGGGSCQNWTSGDIKHTPTGVSELFYKKGQYNTDDSTAVDRYTVTNDVDLMKNEVPPERFGAFPARQ